MNDCISPALVCVSECIFKLPFFLNRLPHSLHPNGSSSEWVLLWWARAPEVTQIYELYTIYLKHRCEALLRISRAKKNSFYTGALRRRAEKRWLKKTIKMRYRWYKNCSEKKNDRTSAFNPIRFAKKWEQIELFWQICIMIKMYLNNIIQNWFTNMCTTDEYKTDWKYKHNIVHSIAFISIWGDNRKKKKRTNFIVRRTLPGSKWFTLFWEIQNQNFTPKTGHFGAIYLVTNYAKTKRLIDERIILNWTFSLRIFQNKLNHFNPGKRKFCPSFLSYVHPNWEKLH